MKISSLLGKKTTDFVGNYCDLSTEDLEKVRYGVETFFMLISKDLFIIMLAYLLGILPYVLLFLISYSLVRLFSFGIHLQSGTSCLFWTSTIFLGLAYASPHISINNLFITLIFVFNIASAILFAPADTEKRPITNKKKRLKLKIKAVVSLLFLYIIAVFYCTPTYSTIITLSALVACIVINPLLYKLLGQQYNNYKYYKKKEA